eukprot:768759-Hanusia_phi.AAC.13
MATSTTRFPSESDGSASIFGRLMLEDEERHPDCALAIDEGEQIASDLVEGVLDRSSDILWCWEYTIKQSQLLLQDLAEHCLADFLQEEVWSTLREALRESLTLCLSSELEVAESFQVNKQVEALGMYKFVVVDANGVESSVRCSKSCQWSEFVGACKRATGMEVSHIKYDDDFGPKQASDIVCAGQEDWQDLLEMMVEDAEEVRDTLRVEMFPVNSSELARSLRLSQDEVQALRKAIRATWTRPTQREVIAVTGIQRCIASRAHSISYFARVEELRMSVQTICSYLEACKRRSLFINRHETAARVLACSYKMHRARRQLVASRILTETVSAWCVSIAEEQRAYRRNWIISQATPAAQSLQALLSRRLAPNLAAIRDQEAEQQRASRVLQAFARGHLVLKMKLAKEIAALQSVDMLTGQVLQRALHVLVYKNQIELLQSVLRRVITCTTLAGNFTILSSELAMKFALEDLLELLIHADQTYQDSLQRAAAQLLGDVIKRRVLSSRHAEMISSQRQLKLRIAALNLRTRHRKLRSSVALLLTVMRSRVCQASFRDYRRQVSKVSS